MIGQGFLKYARGGKEYTVPENSGVTYSFVECKDLEIYMPRSIKRVPYTKGHEGYPIMKDCEKSFIMIYKDADELRRECEKYRFLYKILKD